MKDFVCTFIVARTHLLKKVKWNKMQKASLNCGNPWPMITSFELSQTSLLAFGWKMGDGKPLRPATYVEDQNNPSHYRPWNLQEMQKKLCRKQSVCRRKWKQYNFKFNKIWIFSQTETRWFIVALMVGWTIFASCMQQVATFRNANGVNPSCRAITAHSFRQSILHLENEVVHFPRKSIPLPVL